MSAERCRLRRASAADASAIADVYVRTWRAAYRDLLSPSLLRQMRPLRETLFWWTTLCDPHPGSVTFVLEDAEAGIVGFVSGGPDRGRGAARRAEVYTLYLLPSFQRRGLGTRLLAACVRSLLANGFDSLVIWVLSGNPARAFYDALGGVPVAARTLRLGGRFVQEVGYDWPDLHSVAAATAQPRCNP